MCLWGGGGGCPILSEISPPKQMKDPSFHITQCICIAKLSRIFSTNICKYLFFFLDFFQDVLQDLYAENIAVFNKIYFRPNYYKVFLGLLSYVYELFFQK